MRTRFAPEALADPEFARSEKEIRACVHCGFCLPTCPTYVVLGDELDSPRGRIRLMQEMLERGLGPSAETVKHVDRCLSCLACVTACPSGVDYGRLAEHARAYIDETYRRPWPDALWRWMVARVLPYPARLRRALDWARLARPLAPLLGVAAALKPLAAMVRLAPGRVGEPALETALPAAGERPRIALLGGCAEPVLRPEIREAAVRVLEKAGFAVGVAAGEGCCGALVHHMGRRAEALAAARRNVAAWEAAIEDGGLAAIVTTASGCGTMIKDYGFLLKDEPEWAERAARVSALARDISEVLDEAGLPPRRGGAAPMRVAYMAPCSLRHGQKVVGPPERLLAAAGYTVLTPADGEICCGSAGTYNILQSDIAAKLKARKVRVLEETGADVVAAGNIGCLTQIGEAAGRPALHPIELLDWATGGPRPWRLG